MTSLSIKTNEKQKKKFKGNCKVFCVTRNASQYRQLQRFSRYKETQQEVREKLSNSELNLLPAKFMASLAISLMKMGI